MKQLFQTATKQSYKSNREIDLGASIGYVSSGYVSLVANIDGQEVVLQLFGPGEVINAPTNLIQLGNMTEATLNAHGPVTLHCLLRDEFNQQLSKKRDYQAKYIAHLQQQHSWLLAQQAALGYKDIHRRLVARILYLAERFGKGKDKHITLGLVMTHRQLATSVSSTRETVNKLMKQLESSKLIAIKNRAIHIHSIKDLAKELDRPGS